MSGINEIPDGYDLKKIMQELLKLLEERNVLDSYHIKRIVNKGRPKP
jgi:hypothetical protein